MSANAFENIASNITTRPPTAELRLAKIFFHIYLLIFYDKQITIILAVEERALRKFASFTIS